MGSLVIGIIAFIVIILAIRLFGAWMLRIDVIIKNQEKIISELKKGNSNSNKSLYSILGFINNFSK